MIYNYYVLTIDYNYLQTCLWSICRTGYLPAIKWLQTNELLIRHNQMCFITACSNGQLEIVKYLYEFVKSDIYTLDKAYHLSIINNNIDVAQWIYKQGFIVSRKFIDLTLSEINKYKNVSKYKDMIYFLKLNICTDNTKYNIMDTSPLIDQSWFINKDF
jgi:ankyrin repeat protein